MTNVSVSPAFNQNAVGLNPPAGFTAGISMGGTGGEDRFIDTNSTLLTVGHANGVIAVSHLPGLDLPIPADVRPSGFLDTDMSILRTEPAMTGEEVFNFNPSSPVAPHVQGGQLTGGGGGGGGGMTGGHPPMSAFLDGNSSILTVGHANGNIDVGHRPGLDVPVPGDFRSPGFIDTDSSILRPAPGQNGRLTTGGGDQGDLMGGHPPMRALLDGNTSILTVGHGNGIIDAGDCSGFDIPVPADFRGSGFIDTDSTIMRPSHAMTGEEVFNFNPSVGHANGIIDIGDCPEGFQSPTHGLVDPEPLQTLTVGHAPLTGFIDLHALI